MRRTITGHTIVGHHLVDSWTHSGHARIDDDAPGSDHQPYWFELNL